MKQEPGLSWLIPILAMVITVGSCSSSDTTREGQQRIPTYEGQSQARPDSNSVAVGDSIALSVWDAPQFNTHSIVKSNGMTSIPLVGEMKVAGYGKDELAQMFRRRLSEYIKGDILLSVEVLSPSPKISVFGLVAHQGSVSVSGQLPLVDALIAAGGWSDAADLRYLRITRQSRLSAERNSIEFDLTQFLETGDMRGMPIVYPGDIVIVPKKEDYVQEFGAFVGSIIFLFGIFSLLR